MLSELQKRTAQAIVNIFETGRVLGDYASVTMLPGDAGHITYGRSQATLASGNLHLLIKTYCGEPNAVCADTLRHFLGRLAATDFSLDNDWAFRAALTQAGDDPAMRQVQDRFFDAACWVPAERAATALAFISALAVAVIYDSHVHGSWSALRQRTSREHGAPALLGERAWISAYVAERRDWLGTHSNPLLRRTVYRMDEFRLLIGAENWHLAIPLRVRGIRIDGAALGLPKALAGGGAN